MSRYYPGSGVRITLTCYDITGALTNPTSLVLQHQNPAGDKTEVVLVNDSVGVYHGDYTFVAADAENRGHNEFEATASGAVIDAGKLFFKVHEL